MGEDGLRQVQVAVFNRYACRHQVLPKIIAESVWSLGLSWGDNSANLKVE